MRMTESRGVTMSTLMKRAGLIATISALIGVAACGKDSRPMDATLKQDLAAAGGGDVELAPRTAQSQLVISPIEAGETSTPVRAVRKPVVKPTTRPAARVAANT